MTDECLSRAVLDDLIDVLHGMGPTSAWTEDLSPVPQWPAELSVSKPTKAGAYLGRRGVTALALRNTVVVNGEVQVQVQALAGGDEVQHRFLVDKDAEESLTALAAISLYMGLVDGVTAGERCDGTIDSTAVWELVRYWVVRVPRYSAPGLCVAVLRASCAVGPLSAPQPC